MDDQNNFGANDRAISKPSNEIKLTAIKTIISVRTTKKTWFQKAAIPFVGIVALIAFIAGCTEIPNNVMGWFINWKILFGGSPEWQPEQLPVGTQNVQISLGGNSMEMTQEEINKHTYPYIGNFQPIKWNIQKNRLYIDVDIQLDDRVIQIRGGKFSANLPAKWDMNFNSNALEIVTEKGNPIYQIYYRRPDEVTINGVFVHDGIALVCTTNGFDTYTFPTKQLIDDFYIGNQAMEFNPLFKYPSWKFKGVLAD